jgi:hypothetical protein
MQVPIACTLGRGDATERVDAWREALATSITSVARPTPGRVELHLVHDPGRIGVLVDLASREKACCEFFDFSIQIDALGATLVVAVPDEALAVLDEFEAMAKAQL